LGRGGDAREIRQSGIVVKWVGVSGESDDSDKRGSDPATYGGEKPDASFVAGIVGGSLSGILANPVRRRHLLKVRGGGLSSHRKIRVSLIKSREAHEFYRGTDERSKTAEYFGRGELIDRHRVTGSGRKKFYSEERRPPSWQTMPGGETRRHGGEGKREAKPYQEKT